MNYTILNNVPVVEKGGQIYVGPNKHNVTKKLPKALSFINYLKMVEGTKKYMSNLNEEYKQNLSPNGKGFDFGVLGRVLTEIGLLNKGIIVDNNKDKKIKALEFIYTYYITKRKIRFKNKDVETENTTTFDTAETVKRDSKEIVYGFTKEKYEKYKKISEKYEDPIVDMLLNELTQL